MTEASEMTSALVTAEEAAEQLRVHKATIIQMVKRGDLKAVQVGTKRVYRVYQASIDAYLQANAVEVE